MTNIKQQRAAFELPPLPAHPELINPDGYQPTRYSQIPSLYEWAKSYARAAIELNRQGRGEPVDIQAEFNSWWSSPRSPLGCEYEESIAKLAWHHAWKRSAEAIAPQPAEPAHCPTDVCQAAKSDGILCANDECDRANGVRPAEPVKVPSDEVTYEGGKATWMGMPVRGWRWKARDAKNPQMFPPDGMVVHFATHWSTGPKDAERLYSESDIRALLASYGQPAQPATQYDPQAENAAFHEWWDANQVCPEHTLTTENAAHATWQERAKRAAQPAANAEPVAIVDHVGSSYGKGPKHPTVIVTHSANTKELTKGTRLYTSAQHTVTDDMVSRFLGWKLPDDFFPDAGISFKAPQHPNGWPIGTNLLTADQARAMLEYVLQGATVAAQQINPIPQPRPVRVGRPSASAPSVLGHLTNVLQGLADQAYMNYIRQMQKEACLGVEHKLENDKFGVAELAAHNQGYELLGRHRAFSEAANMLKGQQ